MLSGMRVWLLATVLTLVSCGLFAAASAKAEDAAAEQSVQQQKAISKNADAIFRSPVTPVAGNPNGDVSVVEFFDYNCPYCRRALPDVLKLINQDGKVRLVLKELPILSDDSVAAAKLALAANKQGKYFEMHQKLCPSPAGLTRIRHCGSPRSLDSISLSFRRTRRTPTSRKRSTRTRNLP